MPDVAPDASPVRRIVVIGAGAAGLSAAWRLGEVAEVTVLEAEGRLGGHANTLDAPGPGGDTPVDTGFIVYNEDQGIGEAGEGLRVRYHNCVSCGKKLRAVLDDPHHEILLRPSH